VQHSVGRQKNVSEETAVKYLLLQTPSRKHQLHPSIPHGAETEPVFSPKMSKPQQKTRANIEMITTITVNKNTLKSE